MNRKRFLTTAVLLAVLFVPVWLLFPFSTLRVPTIWVLVQVGRSVIGWNLWGVAILIFYSAVYLSLFYALARLSLYLINRFVPERFRLGLQITILVALFTTSFARVLTYDSWSGSGGIYNFWGAVDRFVTADPTDSGSLSLRRSKRN